VSTQLDTRYGRTPGRRTRHRVVAIAAGIGVVVVVVAWLAWGGLLSPSASLESESLGYDEVTDRSIVVMYEVTTTPGNAVTCAVEARDEDHAVVGWTTVELPPSDKHVRQFRERLRTTGTPVVGLISDCWLT
jgi:hypothetical protein